MWRLESEAQRKEKIQRLASRLNSRTPESLATFIASLAKDLDPLGDHVKTFVVGDNLAEATLSIRKRIDALRLSERRHPRCGAWVNVGQRVEYILEDIETLILPVSPATEFELLVLIVERDEDVMIQCGDFLAVDSLITRAAALLTLAAKSLPSAEVRKTILRLVREGDFWRRVPLFDIGMAGNDSGNGVSGEKHSAPNA